MMREAPPPSLSAKVVHERPDRVCLAVAGDIDMDGSPALRQVLARYVGRGRQVILDMSEVTFIDCFGLRVLLCTQLRDPEFRVMSPSPAVRRLVELTQTPLPWYEGEFGDLPPAEQPERPAEPSVSTRGAGRSRRDDGDVTGPGRRRTQHTGGRAPDPVVTPRGSHASTFADRHRDQ